MIIRQRPPTSFLERFLPKSTIARIEWVAAIALSSLLILLPWLLKLDGRPHADWQQFLGRFHPLTVHLPIGSADVAGMVITPRQEPRWAT